MTQKELTDRLDRASVLYYAGETSEFTDTEFDLKLKELQQMEKESGIVYPNSPTQRVGSDIQSGWGKIRHPRPMLTIENTYDDAGLDEWVRKMRKSYGVEKFNVSVKYDGISCEIHYKDGAFCDASTRGDKLTGDDITENVKTIRSVPLRIDFPAGMACEDFYVRGEILLPKSRLESINAGRIADGEEPFANTRNACSGSIKQLDPKVTARRGLVFRAWDCYSTDRTLFRTMAKKAPLLRKCGFYYEKSTLPFTEDADNMEQAVNEFKALIDSIGLDFDYDGIVAKVDSLEIQEKIGTKDTRAIEWGIARKWNEQYEVWTTLKDVVWQVGRTGAVTPVGILEPVECSGVIISNVTLHNADFIEKLDIHIDDALKITRSGGVIPYVLQCKHDNSDGIFYESLRVVPPTLCPSCGKPLVREGAILKCVNLSCPAIIQGKLLQFCSKDGMDIRTIGEKVVEDFVGKLHFSRINDLYSLGDGKSEYGDAASLAAALGEGYGEAKCQNIIDSIKASVDKPFESVLASVSIPGVGKAVGRLLASRLHSYEALKNATVEELTEIDGIGDIMANDIVDWVKDEDNDRMMSALASFGLQMSSATEEYGIGADKPLSGLSIVFSGKSFRFSGDDVEDFLEQMGAKCGHSVSGKTDYLVTGEKPGGSKLAKAGELGIQIVKEEDFYRQFGI